MADIKLSSLLPEWRQAPSTHHNFFKRISSRVASWLPVTKGPVLVDKGPDLFIPSLWDRLIASSPPQPYSSAASTALRSTYQKGALISNLPEFVPCLGKYCLASVGGRHPGGSVSSTSVEPHYVLSSTTSTSHPLVVITLPPTIITPVIPTIVVTDIDGPPPSGINDNCPDQMYRAMTCGRGLLWSQWSGRFSPSRCGSEARSRDGVYLQDQPGDDVEEFVELDNEDIENCFKLRNGITLNAPGKFEVATSTSGKLKPIPQEPKELEWWEIEGDDDETGSGDEDSEDSLEDDSESESDSEFDEDQEFDSEHGNYEYAGGSNDDDSGEDSDLGESEDSENILAPANLASGLGALIPPPHQKPNSNIHAHAKDTEFVDRDAQDIKEGFLLPLPLPRPN